MSFTIDTAVGPRVKKALLKKYQDLAKVQNTAMSHITNANGEVFKFVIFSIVVHNQFAVDLYNGIKNKFPVVTNENRKQVEKELDEATKTAYANLPSEKAAREAYTARQPK